MRGRSKGVPLRYWKTAWELAVPGVFIQPGGRGDTSWQLGQANHSLKLSGAGSRGYERHVQQAVIERQHVRHQASVPKILTVV
jgi:hypothetical protein